ncbi:ABC transporter ATP-binding protein [candidate division KSB3 bacterium]|uniref:ABC transporter ATP-binding protein n=1 Tax=candidate division KSB3 bacterium TaxID=2044937 RepID=A0A2G6EDY5_9BACT|nr:MAG: ABC transporter ATP-binding protein [candidate division KSB3 bacterium]
MSYTVIKIENLSKLYRLGEVGTGTLSHDLNRWWARVRGKEDPYAKIGQVNDRTQKAESDYVWALKDVNLEVKHGDILGIIGKNGAGKSTLLKLISRITAPTTGSIKGKGRIASLLEVGTGMNPQMTARENIYLNGAILGMNRQEITRKFDDIVDFAGCAMYVDTPVKRYSSGMRVRLGFAVAAFLEPDILIVDEVLAVGDAEFQKKAIGKMKDVSSSKGRTVLFVSHNMGSVETLCDRAILLNNGSIVFESRDVREAIKKYLYANDNGAVKPVEWVNTDNRCDSPFFKPLRFWLSDEYGNLLTMPVRNDQAMYVNISFEIKELDSALAIACWIYDEKNRLLFVTEHTDSAESSWKIPCQGKDHFRFKIPERLLNEGIYRIELAASLYKRMWLIQNGKENINIFLHIAGGLSDSPQWLECRGGIIAPVIQWE